MTLQELFKQGTQVKYGSKGGQLYLPVYDILFKDLQDKPVNIFEVGFLGGQSAQLWLDFFPKAQVRCIDIAEEMVKWYMREHVINLSPRLKVDILDSNNLTPEYFKDFIPDIAIDDGSHELADQLHFIKTVYPLLKPGGILVVEDVYQVEDKLKAFEELGWPFTVADMRPPELKDSKDMVLIIYTKM
jgi:SAM-dependent methyltransferase